MIAAARQGKTVVRLKAGDPCVFGCLAEEVGALRAAGIPLQIIPGVTAGLAVAAYAEIPVTHGESLRRGPGHRSSTPREGRAAAGLRLAGRLPGHADHLHGRDQRGEWSGP